METIWIFLVVAVYVSEHAVSCGKLQTETNNKFDDFTLVAEKIINEIYAGESPTVNFISSAGASSQVDRIFERVFKSQMISVVLESSSNIVGSVLRKWNIFHVDSVQSFGDIYEQMTPKRFGFHGYYTIILTSETTDGVSNIFKAMWKKQIYNVVIVHVTGSTVKVSTFNPFSPKSCNDVKAIEVKNRSDLFNDKLKNLKQCSLNVHAPEWAPFTFVDNSKTTGRDFDLMKVLSEVLNFKLNFTILTELAAWGMVFDNGTSTGAIKNLLDFKADIIIGDYYLRSARIKYMDASASYFTADIVFIIPPGRTLKSIEKLLQPFSRTVWTLLSASLLFALLMTFGLCHSSWKKLNNWNKMFDLYFKMLSVLLGVSLPRLPQKLATRFLLISLTISCISLQAIYQGLLFKFLQTDSKLREVQSIDEMVDNHFDVYSYDSMLEVIQSESRITER